LPQGSKSVIAARKNEKPEWGHVTEAITLIACTLNTCFFQEKITRRKQHRSSVESAPLPPMWPGFNLDLVPYVVDFSVVLSPCFEGFSGAPVFFPPQKPILQIAIRSGERTAQLRLSL